MNIAKRPILRLLLLIFIVTPAIAWFAVRPVRALAPNLMGLSCTGKICVEDEAELPTAQALYTEALAFVNGEISPLDGAPRVLFCSSTSCAESFGLGARSAVTIGTYATIIGPRAWKSYYLRHELIHQLQGQRIGVLRQLFKPQWFTEGMAYSLSDDPRRKLDEPWQSCRIRFNKWVGTIAKERFWEEAEKL